MNDEPVRSTGPMLGDGMPSRIAGFCFATAIFALLHFGLGLSGWVSFICFICVFGLTFIAMIIITGARDVRSPASRGLPPID